MFHQLSRDDWESGSVSYSSLAFMKEQVTVKQNNCIALIIWSIIKTYFSILSVTVTLGAV